MLDHYRMFAAYNAWANGVLYEAAATLTDKEYRADRGAFFGSMHRTLNHLLATDRIWFKRITGTGDAPDKLDAILHEDLASLAKARRQEDDRIIAFVETLTTDQLAGTFTYTPITIPEPVTQRLAPVLAHVFNHQTHHRGQAHAILTSLGKPSVILDLIYFQRTPEGKVFR